MAPEPAKIGLIGIGLLGSAIAERMLAARLDVVGFDVSDQQQRWLRDQGGGVARTISDLFKSCHHVVLSLPDSQIVQTVLREVGQDIQPGLTILDTTTGAPATTVALAHQLAGQGGYWLDTTVAGSSLQMRRGEALVMVGGDEQAVTKSAKVLDAFAPKRIYVGSVGNAAKMKLVVNLALGLNRAALAEALAFGEGYGLDPATILQVLKSSPAYSSAMDAKGEKMLQRDFAPQARLRQHLKDVRLILEAGKAHGAKMPMSQLHEKLLQSLAEAGFGEEDNSAILRAFLPAPDASVD